MTDNFITTTGIKVPAISTAQMIEVDRIAIEGTLLFLQLICLNKLARH
ncbi:MAG: hypothetical protein GY936_06700 [Ignavibacteriae bacterium]|nr:hypothetical protein [Ignavibacteriota bacterium]